MIILFILYKEQCTIKSIREVEMCLFKNLSNPIIDKIVLITDMDINLPFDKIIIHRAIQAPIDITDKYADEHDICITAPPDVYADETLSKLKYIDWDKGIYLQLGDIKIFKGKYNAHHWVFNPSLDILFHGNVKQGKITPHYLDVVKTKPLTKIAHIGMWSYYPDGEYFDTEYKFFDWQPYSHFYKLKENKRREFESKVMELAYWADVIWVHTQCDIIPKELFKKMSYSEIENRMKIVYNYTGDVREQIPSWMIDVAPYCITLFSNDTDVQKMRAKGLNSYFFNVIFSDEKYNPKGYKEVKEPILFMGNNYKNNGVPTFPLSMERELMVQLLKKEYGTDFGVYGNGWDFECESLMNEPQREAALYRGAKIGINYSHFNYSRYSSDRLFRIMGCGCFCLTHNYKDIEKDFQAGVHLDVFNSLDELKEKVDYYLTHEEERARIAKAGCEIVHREYAIDKYRSKLLSVNYLYPKG